MLPTQTPPASSKVTDDQLAKWEQLTRDLIRRNDMDLDDFQAFMGYPHLAAEMDKIVRKALEYAEKCTSQKAAKAIMGKNFFGIQEATKHFGVKWTKDQLQALVTVPFGADVLKASKDTHVLVAGYPLSVLDVREKAEKGLFHSFKGTRYDNWYDHKGFAYTPIKVGWYLVRKTPVNGSTHKDWTDQRALLTAEETVPKTCLMVYTIIGHFLATDVRLFKSVNVCCSDSDFDGGRITVGEFGSGGLKIGGRWGHEPAPNIGIAAFRNPSKL